MKYIKEDLDYIFIRAKDSKGKWGNISLTKVSDNQFVDWATKNFGIEIRDDASAKGEDWTPEQKIKLLNDMSKRIGKPCVVMIKRSARKEWNK